MTLDDLGDRLFADVPQAAAILGRDRRTIRRAAEAKEIPASKVGNKWMIPTAWLRQQAGTPLPAATAEVDYDKLADLVTDRMVVRFARLLAGGLPLDMTAAGPVGAEPAAIDAPLPREDTSDGQRTVGSRR